MPGVFHLAFCQQNAAANEGWASFALYLGKGQFHFANLHFANKTAADAAKIQQKVTPFKSLP